MVVPITPQLLPRALAAFAFLKQIFRISDVEIREARRGNVDLPAEVSLSSAAELLVRVLKRLFVPSAPQTLEGGGMSIPRLVVLLFLAAVSSSLFAAAAAYPAAAASALPLVSMLAASMLPTAQGELKREECIAFGKEHSTMTPDLCKKFKSACVTDFWRNGDSREIATSKDLKEVSELQTQCQAFNEEAYRTTSDQNVAQFGRVVAMQDLTTVATQALDAAAPIAGHPAVPQLQQALSWVYGAASVGVLSLATALYQFCVRKEKKKKHLSTPTQKPRQRASSHAPSIRDADTPASTAPPAPAPAPALATSSSDAAVATLSRKLAQQIQSTNEMRRLTLSSNTVSGPRARTPARTPAPSAAAGSRTRNSSRARTPLTAGGFFMEKPHRCSLMQTGGCVFLISLIITFLVQPFTNSVINIQRRWDAFYDDLENISMISVDETPVTFIGRLRKEGKLILDTIIKILHTLYGSVKYQLMIASLTFKFARKSLWNTIKAIVQWGFTIPATIEIALDKLCNAMMNCDKSSASTPASASADADDKRMQVVTELLVPIVVAASGETVIPTPQQVHAAITHVSAPPMLPSTHTSPKLAPKSPRSPQRTHKSPRSPHRTHKSPRSPQRPPQGVQHVTKSMSAKTKTKEHSPKRVDAPTFKPGPGPRPKRKQSPARRASSKSKNKSRSRSRSTSRNKSKSKSS